MILHCMRKSLWEERKSKLFWGEEEIQADGFIHCSTVEYFWRVALNFQGITDELVILCIDENKLQSEVCYEDGDHCGRAYPHVYGVIHRDAVVDVLCFRRDEHGDYIKNPELAHIENE